MTAAAFAASAWAQDGLTAETARRIAAPEADQGAALSRTHIYAVDNSLIAKYDLKTGEKTGAYEDEERLLRHMNSCLVIDEKLMCANSNYSQLPMGSSVEIFDPESLAHLASHSLGLMDEGSLVWFDRVEGGWLVGFAHYDGERGTGFKDHTYASVITMDDQWRRTGGWLFPDAVMERMAPHAASGGAIGPDGLLYVLGHDRPEMYVFAKPERGPVLQHVTTIAVEAEGQAFSFAVDGSRRIAAVDRYGGALLLIDLPEVDVSGLKAAQFFRNR
ncbi:hypothetical protein [Hyphococcus sp.]|uniref:hypothetical protein n=1 Tax=Hyphococcus sp. TaxID=2038636 RepID=UPI003D1104BD